MSKVMRFPVELQSGWKPNRLYGVSGRTLPSLRCTISILQPVSVPFEEKRSRSTTNRLPSGDHRARSTSVGNVERTTMRTLRDRRSITRIESPEGGPAVGGGFEL